MNRQTKTFLLVVGVGLIMTACILGGSWLPAISFPFMLLSPLPIMMAANCADDGLFSTQKSGPVVEFGFFLTGILLSSVFALPVVLALVKTLDQMQAGLCIVGAASIVTSIFFYQVIFNSSSDEE